MSAYYNENDKFAAAWLRELIRAGLIADGEVDERSIEEVKPDDLRGFTQCHFFAGVGVWSYALRNAGWSDDLAVWTGSCPCQSFSASGKGEGFSDKRHLWPSWFRLISESRPLVVFGEQVASKDGLAWLDVVSADLEGADYTFGAADLCAAGFGAPHIRQRLYFVAISQRGQCGKIGICGPPETIQPNSEGPAAKSTGNGEIGDLGHPAISGNGPLVGKPREGSAEQEPIRGSGVFSIVGKSDIPRSQQRRERGTALGYRNSVITAGRSGELGDTEHFGLNSQNGKPSEQSGNGPKGGLSERANFTNGFWRDAEWIYCRDEKFRPVEPGTFPLASSAPARVGRLRGYGNAINAEVAQAFIEAYMRAA